MKRFTLILVLVILISLMGVGPALAGGGDNLCGVDSKFPGKMWGAYYLGFGHGKGNPTYYGSLWWGRHQACSATPPKNPSGAGN